MTSVVFASGELVEATASWTSVTDEESVWTISTKFTHTWLGRTFRSTLAFRRTRGMCEVWQGTVFLHNQLRILLHELIVELDTVEAILAVAVMEGAIWLREALIAQDWGCNAL